MNLFSKHFYPKQHRGGRGELNLPLICSQNALPLSSPTPQQIKTLKRAVVRWASTDSVAVSASVELTAGSGEKVESLVMSSSCGVMRRKWACVGREGRDRDLQTDRDSSTSRSQTSSCLRRASSVDTHTHTHAYMHTHTQTRGRLDWLCCPEGCLCWTHAVSAVQKRIQCIHALL